jgi:hypothetical protein
MKSKMENEATDVRPPAELKRCSMNERNRLNDKQSQTYPNRTEMKKINSL